MIFNAMLRHDAGREWKTTLSFGVALGALAERLAIAIVYTYMHVLIGLASPSWVAVQAVS